MLGALAVSGRRVCISWIFALAAFLGGPEAVWPATPAPVAERYLLLIVEQAASKLAFYDSRTRERIGEVELDFWPHEVDVTRDGRTAYVANFGIHDYDHRRGTPGLSISEIDIPNMVERRRLFTFDGTEASFDEVSKAPHGVRLRPPDDKRLYVTTALGSALLVFDLDRGSLIHKFLIDPATHNLVFSPDGNTLWLMAGPSGVLRLDPDTGEQTGRFPMESPARGLAYTPDERHLIVSGNDEIYLLDPDDLSVSRHFTGFGVSTIFYSAATPDGRRILAPTGLSGQVLVVDPETGEFARVMAGVVPIKVTPSPDGKLAYVSNAEAEYSTIIDLATFETSQLTGLTNPNGIGFSPYFPYKKRGILTVGLVLPLSGSDLRKGASMLAGYELWKREVNAAGGILVGDEPFHVRLAYRDTESHPERAEALARELVRDEHPKVLLGTYGASANASLRSVASSLAIPFISIEDDIEGSPWSASELPLGFDRFMNRKRFAQQYDEYYPIPASDFPAVAAANGIVLHEALRRAGTLDSPTLRAVLSSMGPLKTFYGTVRPHSD